MDEKENKKVMKDKKSSKAAETQEVLKLDDAILLLDDYNEGSRALHTSLKLAGFDCPAVVIEDDGFLPDDVMSVYGYFLGDFKAALGDKARPKYFNEITVPEYWEISGTNANGKVQDLYKERGRIFYAEPLYKRLVKIVDWLDERGIVRSSDHYNRYGAIYGRTIFNNKGQKVNKSYFSAEGKEVIVENYVTGDIILNEENETHIFPNKTELVLYFFVRANFKQSRIFFNSLSTPFFVSNRLKSQAKRDVLFWQESARDDVPGNMQLIFNDEASRTATVMVQKKKSYDKLMELGAKKEMTHKLGFIYPFVKENKHRSEALICTNSDNIEHCEELVRALPQMHFHIAALTEMSSKLTAMDAYENVSLYPGVKMSILEELFETCDYYFDINHESEIVSAVHKAFLHNQLIFAFKETLHNVDYVAEEHAYPANEWERMRTDVEVAMSDMKTAKTMLQRQKKAAMSETVKGYQNLGRAVSKWENLSEPRRKGIDVMDMQKTLRYVEKKRISIARFGDGEVDLMTGHSIPYQDYDENLAKRLKEVITMPDNDKLLVCLPDVFERRERYNEACNSFWEQHLERYRDFYAEIVTSEKHYGSTFLSRPYIDLVDKSVSGKHFQNMKKLFFGKDVLIVEGFYSRSGVGNDLFQGAKSVERIICPSRNAYSKYEAIFEAIKRHGHDKLILLMLGPTAKVLACDLAFEGYWAVDIGHVDTEYEWYNMGAIVKTKLKNKHSAEFNFDEDIELEKNDKYDGEIVEILSGQG